MQTIGIIWNLEGTPQNLYTHDAVGVLHLWASTMYIGSAFTTRYNSGVGISEQYGDIITTLITGALSPQRTLIQSCIERNRRMLEQNGSSEVISYTDGANPYYLY